MNKTKRDLVSIIIPTYKRNDCLERAIISAENQTYDNIEIIVVDDNAFFPEYRKQNQDILSRHPNVIFIENQKNLGGGLSRNEGIKVSKGKYIAFLDDDDEFLPKKIEKQMKLFKILEINHKVGMIYCYANIIKVNGDKSISKRDSEGICIKENVKKCIAACSWMLCSKKALTDINYFENISSRQDATLILKLFLKEYEVYRVPEVLLNYYWHDGTNGITKIDKKSLEAEKQYFNLFKDSCPNICLKEKQQIYYEFNYRIANLLVLLEEPKESFGYFKEMTRIRILDKRNLKIILGIIFNKIYLSIWNIKEKKKRVG